MKTPLKTRLLIGFAVVFFSLAYVAGSVQILSELRASIAFTQAEIKGVDAHKSLMLPYLQQLESNADKQDLATTRKNLRSITDTSNLIYDPFPTSYYLVVLMANILPDRAYIQHHKLNTQLIDQELNRTLQLLHTKGISFDDGSTKNIEILYTKASQALHKILQARLATYLQQMNEAILFLLLTYFLLCACAYLAARNFVRMREVAEAREKQALLVRLQAANAELESFAYIAAHDLKEPARTIASFATLLEKADGKNLSADGTSYLKTMRDTAFDMNKMVTDILAFAQQGASNTHEKVETVSVERVLDKIVLSFSPVIADKNATIEKVGALPHVVFSAAALERILTNLLQNALLYTDPARAPVVTISTAQCGENWLISVQDNGIGFDPAYAEQIFEPFKRLDTRFSGSGLGLSICRKLAESWGGKITASGKVGIGSVFTLHIPARSA